MEQKREEQLSKRCKTSQRRLKMTIKDARSFIRDTNWWPDWERKQHYDRKWPQIWLKKDRKWPPKDAK